MALFTDGNIATLDDLRRYDSYVLEVSATEGIDLSAKLANAQREIGLEIASFLLRNGWTRELANVIVTEPLLHLHCVQTLELVYRDAYSNQLNDRYSGKWKEYSRLSKKAMDTAFEIGIAVCRKPVSKASLPECSSTYGGNNAETTYYIVVVWRNNEDSRGAMSDVVPVQVAEGYVPSVFSEMSPADGDGWYVYAGTTASTLHRQNDLPLFAGSVWVQDGEPLRDDLPEIPEQLPVALVVERRRIGRG